MNERIQELKEAAEPEIDWAARYHVELNNGEKEKWMNQWFEKFADLLIKDCLLQCYYRGMNDELYIGQLQAANNIEQYFGVLDED